jgi:hypothetical protein
VLAAPLILVVSGLGERLGMHMGKPGLGERVFWFVAGFAVICLIYWLFYLVVEATEVRRVRIPFAAFFLPIMAGVGAAMFAPDLMRERRIGVPPKTTASPAPGRPFASDLDVLVAAEVSASTAAAKSRVLQPSSSIPGGSAPKTPEVPAATDSTTLPARLGLKDDPNGKWTWNELMAELDLSAPSFAEAQLKWQGKYLRQTNDLAHALSRIASHLAFSADDHKGADAKVAAALRLIDRIEALSGTGAHLLRALAYRAQSAYRNDKKAFSHALEAALLDARHYYLIGDLHLRGLAGLAKDPDAAISFYDRVPDRETVIARIAEAHLEAGRREVTIDILSEMLERKLYDATRVFDAILRGSGVHREDMSARELRSEIERSWLAKSVPTNPHLIQAVRNLLAGKAGG